MSVLRVYDHKRSSYAKGSLTRVWVPGMFRADLSVVNSEINRVLKAIERNRSHYEARSRRSVVSWTLGPYNRESVSRGDDITIVVVFGSK